MVQPVGWEFVERWRGSTAHGMVWQLYLMRIEAVFSKAWRVEWAPSGHLHEGQSFTSDDCEAAARVFLAEKKAELGADWERIS